MNEMVDHRQHDFRRKRQRGNHCPRRKRAVVRAVRHAASNVAIELAHDAVHFKAVGTRSIAGGNASATSTIAGKFERIVDGVLLLHVGRTAAILEVINAFGTHEGIPNTAKINPEMRELMRE